MITVPFVRNKISFFREILQPRKHFKLFAITKILFVLLIPFIGTACSTTPARQIEDPWFGQDKFAHFTLSTLTSAVIAKAAKEDGKDNCDAALIGFTVTLSFGAAKESYDKRSKQTLYSYKDMSWNLLGSTLGSLAGSNCR